MTIQPLYDRVLVKVHDTDENVKYKGIIHLPDTAKDKPQIGDVIAVGQGRQFEDGLRPLLVKVDDVVVFGKWSGVPVKLDGHEYLMMQEGDILGIVTDTSGTLELPGGSPGGSVVGDEDE